MAIYGALRELISFPSNYVIEEYTEFQTDNA